MVIFHIVAFRFRKSHIEGLTRRDGGEGEREERKGGTEGGWKMRRVGEDL